MKNQRDQSFKLSLYRYKVKNPFLFAINISKFLFAIIYLKQVTLSELMKLMKLFAIGAATSFPGCSYVPSTGTVKDVMLIVSDDEGIPLKVAKVPGTLKLLFYSDIIVI